MFPRTAIQSSHLLAGLSVDTAYVVRQAYDLPAGTNTIKLQETFKEFMNHPQRSTPSHRLRVRPFGGTFRTSRAATDLEILRTGSF
jgi:hypothetical protein